MIPKIIHYCWFGRNSLPKEALDCINSWKKFCPNYEIKQWNEDNFDLESCVYAQEAYKAKKWAFVSDYARFWILYNYGGLYFDTDVELIAPIDDIIEHGSYMGCEKKTDARVGNENYINSGLGLGMEPHLQIIKEILDDYEMSHFIKNNGTYDLVNNVVVRVTNIFQKYGFEKRRNTIQKIEEITLYPEDYFCPLNYYTGEMNKTDNTRSIHHYTATWQSSYQKFKSKIKKRIGINKANTLIKIKRYFKR